MLWSVGTPARAAAPVNDTFGHATPITTLPFVGQQETAGATNDARAPSSFCDGGGAGVWFKFRPNAGGPVVLHTRGSSYDTVLTIFESEAGRPEYPLQCNDDAARQRSVLTFYPEAGQTYLIQVAGFLGATGHLRLTVDRGGSLSGVVRRAATGSPVAGACVSFVSGTSTYAPFYAYSSATGFYSLDGLPAAEYLPTGCYGSTVRNTAPFYVAEGRVTRHADISLLSGFVEGHTTDWFTHRAVGSICVQALDHNGNFLAGALSTVTGFYRMEVAPGAVDVAFNDCGPNRYAPEFFNGVFDRADATHVTVTDGATTSNINASLRWASTIVGTVRDTFGRGVNPACVAAFSAKSGDFAGFGFADQVPAGSYRIPGLAPQSVVVRADNCGYGSSGLAPAWYVNGSTKADAQPVALYPGITRNVSFNLAPASEIAGVLRRDGGGVAAGECVFALDGDGNYHFGQASETGLYVIGGLASGVDHVRFGGCSALAPEWYRDKAERSDADAVTVPWGGRITVNASLAREGRVRATLVDPSTGKRPEVCAITAPTQDPDGVQYGFPSPTGFVSFGQIGGAQYSLQAYGCGSGIQPDPQTLATFRGAPGSTLNLGTLKVTPRDADGDGIADRADNCPLTPNPSQADSNNDDLGNACDAATQHA
jgi:hypothetical protein